MAKRFLVIFELQYTARHGRVHGKGLRAPAAHPLPKPQRVPPGARALLM